MSAFVRAVVVAECKFRPSANDGTVALSIQRCKLY